MQELRNVLINGEMENIHINVNFHSEHGENGTILALGKMATKSIPSHGAQQWLMKTTLLLEVNGVTVPLLTHPNVFEDFKFQFCDGINA